MNSDQLLIWNELTGESESIGFYTHHNASDIPEGPGVYAWFYPLNLKFKDNFHEQITNIKKIQSYDISNKEELKMSESFDINWDPMKVTLEKDHNNFKLDSKVIETWDKISKQNNNDLSYDLKLYAHLGTIFTRPLYIGLSKNLKNRYRDHLKGYGEDNNFNKRFTDFMDKLNINQKIDDLLFITIQFKQLDKAKNYKDKNLVSNLRLIEKILQALGQPMFSEK